LKGVLKVEKKGFELSAAGLLLHPEARMAIAVIISAVCNTFIN